MFTGSTGGTHLQVRLTPSLEEAGHCQHSTQQRGSQRNVETCSVLLPCCGAAWWWRKPCPPSCLQRSEQGGGGWSLDTECPRPLPGESKPGGGFLVLACREHVCPWRNWNTFWYFQCILSPHLLPDMAPSLILCAFLMWKQPNILGFLGHISFECSVPLLLLQGICTWAWDVGGYSGKAEDSEGPGPALGRFHQTQQETRAQQLVERSSCSNLGEAVGVRGARSVTKSQGSERGGEMGWGQGDLSKQVPSGDIRRGGEEVWMQG